MHKDTTKEPQTAIQNIISRFPRDLTDCPKCGGSGYQNNPDHEEARRIPFDVCYGCGGEGRVMVRRPGPLAVEFSEIEGVLADIGEIKHELSMAGYRIAMLENRWNRRDRKIKTTMHNSINYTYQKRDAGIPPQVSNWFARLGRFGAALYILDPDLALDGRLTVQAVRESAVKHIEICIASEAESGIGHGDPECPLRRALFIIRNATITIGKVKSGWTVWIR